MTQKYDTVAERIGAWKADILKCAIPKQVLECTGPMMKDLPKNSSSTMVFRRWLPYGDVDNQWLTSGTTDAGNAYNAEHVIAEGVTPDADTITPVDITVVLQQYGMLYSFTDKTFDMYEDDIPAAITKQMGGRMGLLQEMIDYAALKACTNKFYGGGGATRASVGKRLTLGGLRNVARSLYNNHAEMVTEVIAPSPNYDTSAIEAGYIVCINTDVIADIRDLPGYVPVEKYGANRKPVHPLEKGSCEEFRFVASPELKPVLDAGATIAASVDDLKSNSTNTDVYPVVIMGSEAWGKMALRGTRGFTPYYHAVGKSDKSDVLAQRGYSGAKMYAASAMLNNGWGAIYEVGASNIQEEA